LPEPAAELLVEPVRDLKDRKSLPSLEILIRLLKSNNGGKLAPVHHKHDSC
jgi:hypothetical protein